MSFLWSIIIGFVAGAVAKLLMPGKQGGGILLTTLLGIAGSLVATYLGQLLGWYQEGEAGGFIAAVFGAILILAVFRLIKGKKTA